MYFPKNEFNEISQDEINWGFYLACDQGNLIKAKYWLTSPDLKLHADINSIGNLGFKAACVNDRYDILEYLILEQNMEIDDATRKWLNGGSASKSVFSFPLKLLEARDLSYSLPEKDANNKFNNKI